MTPSSPARAEDIDNHDPVASARLTSKHGSSTPFTTPGADGTFGNPLDTAFVGKDESGVSCGSGVEHRLSSHATAAFPDEEELRATERLASCFASFAVFTFAAFATRSASRAKSERTDFGVSAGKCFPMTLQNGSTCNAEARIASSGRPKSIATPSALGARSQNVSARALGA